MKFCSWQHFDLKSSRDAKTTFEFQNFKIWIFQMILDGKTTKMKIVDLKKLWNFVIDNFMIWNHLVMQTYVWVFQIWNSNFVNDLGWRNFLNESCRSWKVMKLCSWQFFYLNSFRASNKQFTFGLVNKWGTMIESRQNW